MSRPWSRKIGVAALLTIPVWWQGLHAWANSQRGYLEVDQIGASPFLWLASIAVVGVLLVIGVVPSGRPSASRLALVSFLVVAGALAFVNVAAGLPGGISPAGIALGALSIAQVGLVSVALVAPHGQGGSPSP